MKTDGQQSKHTRWIHAGPIAVRVEVDAASAASNGHPARLAPETVEFLKQVRQRAQRGEIDWLKNVGEVYQRVSA